MVGACPVEALIAPGPPTHQAGFAQQLEVLGGRRMREPAQPGQIPGAPLTLPNKRDHLSAAGVRQRPQGLISVEVLDHDDAK
jgi:hypothetical protein